LNLKKGMVDGAGIKIDEDMLLGVVRPLKSIKPNWRFGKK